MTGITEIGKGVLEHKEELMMGIKAMNGLFQTMNKNKANLGDIEKKEIDKLKLKIKNYLGKLYAEFCYTVPLALDGRIMLKDIYEPLTLITRDNYIDDKSKNIKIEKFDFSIFNGSNRLLIEDSAGMGKTTLAKFLFLSYLEQEHHNDYSCIPLFIELRNIKKGETIKNLIRKSFFKYSEKIEEELIDLLLSQKLIFFLDGFDEIIEEDQEHAINEINNLTNSEVDNYYILSSRPEDLISNFPSYLKYNIKPLLMNEAISLIEKYMKNNLEDFKELKFQITTHKKIVEDFFKTPLLASLLCRAFLYKKTIPASKCDYYTQVFDALYEAHDTSTKKGFNRKKELGKLDFQKVLEEFSLQELANLKITFSESEMNEKLQRVKDDLKIKFDNISLLENFIKQVPLFKKEGNSYLWSHKSMQEFFIALKISKLGEDKEKIIEALMNSKSNKKYINVLDFIFDLEPIIFQKVLLEKFITEIKTIDFQIKGIDDVLKSHLILYPTAVLWKPKRNDEIFNELFTKFDKCESHLKKFLNENNLNPDELRNNCVTYLPECKFYTTFSHHKYYSLLKILNDRNIDIFKKISHKNVFEYEKINKLEYDKKIFYSKDNIESLEMISKIVRRNERKEYFLIDFEKINNYYKSLLQNITKKNIKIKDLISNL
ncbi:MAG: NACHT domain-containing protein [Psychrilyobacter sp.]|uniref:NACHT domain-containing protein n=1 Tax=Psychrilyobacter sp. TaxID=2586924 RepID=UPI003C7179E0